MRLTESDAKNLYLWADEWVLKGADSILANGTPVVVFGAYPLDSLKPWLQLSSNSKSLDISAAFIKQLVAPHLAEILAEQTKRSQFKKV